MAPQDHSSLEQNPQKEEEECGEQDRGRGEEGEKGSKEERRNKKENGTNWILREEAKKKSLWDFPGNPAVKNLPSKAGGHRFDSWSGSDPHALGK